MTERTIIEKKRLRELLESELKLQMLQAGGVDNWDGYSDALYPEDEDGFDVLFAALPTLDEMDDADAGKMPVLRGVK